MASDEFVLDTPVVRAFVADVRAAIDSAGSPEEACELIRPRFAELIADPGWLPTQYRQAASQSGMGGGIGQWLLYRSVSQRCRANLVGSAAGQSPPARPNLGPTGAAQPWAEDGSLSLFSLVVPPGAETPVHDHLAWGLVGLYRGTQDEEIYAKRNGALELVERRALGPGDFYALIPPRDDIHRVRTTSTQTSVSIHLLTNDTGCVWRHSYDPETGHARPFRSGYVNAACADEPQDAESASGSI